MYLEFFQVSIEKPNHQRKRGQIFVAGLRLRKLTVGGGWNADEVGMCEDVGGCDIIS